MQKATFAAVLIVLGAAVAASQAAPYAWVGPSNGDWLTAGNWSGTPAFVDDPTNVCDINSDGTANVTTSSIFSGQININAGGTLNQMGYANPASISQSLHLNGGTLTLHAGDSMTVNGGIYVDANSALNAFDGDNGTLSTPSLSGSGNLAVTNNQPGGRNLTMFVGNGLGYGGVMTLGGTGYYQIQGILGGTLHINPTVAGVSLDMESFTQASPVNLELDLNGRGISFDNRNNVQTGLMTLLSDAIVQSHPDYYGKLTTLSGKITGTGKLTLYSRMDRDINTLALVVNNSQNDYSGGTEIMGGPTEAKLAHSLGTGNVQVDAGATLAVDVSDVIPRTADLYLDYDSTANKYGRLNLASGSVTTVANVYTGGRGGWVAPVGYTALPKGAVYTSANLPNYITGTGTLVILDMPSTVSDLAAGNPDWYKVDLTWTAPSAMPPGPVTRYDLRYSTSPISDGAAFDSATPVSGLPTPKDPGSPESLAVTGLSASTTYYFALKSVDSGGNWSSLSNVASAVTSPLDMIAPAAVSNLAIVATGSNHMTLSWTATGDDGGSGTASTYDLRYSTSPIATDADFAAAAGVADLSAPMVAGSNETATISGLTPSTAYYVALKVADEISNWSALSNVVSTTTGEPDSLPPLAITDLAGAGATSDTVTPAWTAPADQGSAGTARYDLRYSLSPITGDADFAAATAVTGLPAPATAGTAEQFTVRGLLPATVYYFAIKTADAAEPANTSPLSNVASIRTASDLAIWGTPRQINTFNSSGYDCFNPVALYGAGSYIWDLASNPGSCFAIDSARGSVHPARALTAGDYPITVRVTDAKGDTATKDVVISVVDTGLVVLNTDTIFDNYGGSLWFCSLGIFANGFGNTASGTTWTLTDPSGYFGLAQGYDVLTFAQRPPPAGDYTIGLALTQNGNHLGPFSFTIHVISSQKITNIDFAPGTVSTSQGAGVIVGTASAIVWEPGYRWSIPSANSDNGTFTILDPATGVVTLTKTPALGDRTITIKVTDGLNACSQAFTVHVQEGTVVPASNLMLTVPSNLDNYTSSGTLGTPTVTGIPGAKAWSFTGDGVGYRYAIDAATGTISIIGCLSYNPTIDGVDYSDVLTVTCTDGINSCTNSFPIPVAACVGPVLNVGPGQTFARLDDAIGYCGSRGWGRSFAGVTFNVYPSDDPNYYLNDGQTYPVRGVFPVPLTIQGAPGQRFPKFRGSGLYYAKGFFMSYNYDLWVKNIEIQDVTTGGNGSGNDNMCGVCKESGSRTGNVFLDNFYIHDCQNGMARGAPGCKWFVTNGRVSHCGIGTTGYTHNIYVLGDLAYFKNVLTDQSSVGHTLKSRCKRTIIDSCRIYDGEHGHGSIGIDLPEGGDDTVINTIVQKGPNWQNPYGIHFADAGDSSEKWPTNRLTVSGCSFFADAWLPGSVVAVTDVSKVGAVDALPASITMMDNSFFGYLPANYESTGANPSGALGATRVTGSVTLAAQPPLDWSFPGPGPDPTIDSPPGPFLAPYGVVGGPQITVPVDEIRISASVPAGSLVVQPTWLPGNSGATAPTWSLRKNAGSRYAIDPVTGAIATAAALVPGVVDVLEIDVAQPPVQMYQWYGGPTYYDHPTDGSYIHSIYIVVSAPGDANGDGYVNVGDLQAVVAAWGSNDQGGCWNWDPNYDFNIDGYVNVGDLQILVAHWNM